MKKSQSKEQTDKKKQTLLNTLLKEAEDKMKPKEQIQSLTEKFEQAEEVLSDVEEHKADKKKETSKGGSKKQQTKKGLKNVRVNRPSGEPKEKNLSKTEYITKPAEMIPEPDFKGIETAQAIEQNQPEVEPQTKKAKYVATEVQQPDEPKIQVMATGQIMDKEKEKEKVQEQPTKKKKGKYKATEVQQPSQSDIQVMATGNVMEKQQKGKQELPPLHEEKPAPLPEEKPAPLPEEKPAQLPDEKTLKQLNKKLLAQSVIVESSLPDLNLKFKSFYEKKELEPIANIKQSQQVEKKQEVIPQSMKTSQMLKSEASIKKWERLIKKAYQYALIQRKLNEFKILDQNIRKQQKLLSRLTNKTLYLQKILCLPKDHMHQSQLVENYVEFEVVSQKLRKKLH